MQKRVATESFINYQSTKPQGTFSLASSERKLKKYLNGDDNVILYEPALPPPPFFFSLTPH